MTVRFDQAVPPDQAWFVFKVSEEANFRILLNRMKPQDAARNRKKFLRTDETGAAIQDDERWFKFLAEDVIVEWDGVTDQDDKPWPYTVERGLDWIRRWGAFKSFVESKYIAEDDFRKNAGSGLASSTSGAKPAAPRKGIRAVGPVEAAD